MSTIRTRFAPSPTGYMHIGNLRTALYEYLVAKSQDGQFILRIEDTDQKRLVEDSVDVIYHTLKIAGLVHDEGPDKGGPFGPYVQSERKDLYLPYAEELVQKGHAYYCFCSKERLDSLRDECELNGRSFHYDRHCLSLSAEDIESKLHAGMPFVIRQKMPITGNTTFTDLVYGSISVDNSELDDQILIKSDGYPTYNFANIVDDHLMQITHVVRGSEYLSSTPKYNLLYQAFGWDIPCYIHLPLINKPGGGKLSKREGDPSFEDLISLGFLVEAVINYVALLGWSPGDEREFFTLRELEEAFNVKGISKSPAIFDIQKLTWMNGEYIRKMTAEAFHSVALPYYNGVICKQDIDLTKVSAVLQKRTDVLGLIPESIDFFDKLPDYDISIYINKKMKTTLEISLESLKHAFNLLSSLDNWDTESLHNSLIGLAETMGIKNGQMLWPLRTALSGKPVTPGGAIELADILGRQESLDRISDGIKRLERALRI